MNSYYLPVSPAISIHYRDNKATGLSPLLLLHSLSDNSHVYDAIIAAGVSKRFRVVVPDMRGRGNSSRPGSGYSLEHHCADLIALLDNLGIAKTVVAGHSFGGMLGLYFAAHYPDRVLGLVMIDAAAELNPLTPVLITMLADRLGKLYASTEIYINKARAMPCINRWDEDMRRTFLADTDLLTDKTVFVKTQKAHIMQCALAVATVPKRAWREWALLVPGPSMVLYASQPFMHGQHILIPHKALETAVLLPGGAHHEIRGNHITMMYGKGAAEIAAQLLERFGARERIPGRYLRNPVPPVDNMRSGAALKSVPVNLN